jgi:hypothetical protein
MAIWSAGHWRFSRTPHCVNRTQYQPVFLHSRWIIGLGAEVSAVVLLIQEGPGRIAACSRAEDGGSCESPFPSVASESPIARRSSVPQGPSILIDWLRYGATAASHGRLSLPRASAGCTPICPERVPFWHICSPAGRSCHGDARGSRCATRRRIRRADVRCPIGRVDARPGP